MAIPSKKTVAKLRKLQAFLRAEPRRFDMEWWGLSVEDVEKFDGKAGHGGAISEAANTLKKQHPPCGTVACLAGSICIMQEIIKPEFLDEIPVYTFPSSTGEKAAEWLGLNFAAEAGKLFFTSDMDLMPHTGRWPGGFTKRYRKAKTPRQKVKVACERIDHYIETGE